MKSTGVWSSDQVRVYLDQAVIPLRLAVQNRRGPLVLSLWFTHIDGLLWCATNNRARLIEYLGSDPRCGFEIAADQPPYRGVRGQGTATLHPTKGEAILRRLLNRYGVVQESRLARDLLSRSDQEIAVAIEPAAMTSWDFTARMKDAAISQSPSHKTS
jgi:hypothetical protein